MSENELQAKLSIQLGQALSGLKSLSGELRNVKQNVAELTKNTNQMQQESAKTTKVQVDGATQAGKATKTFNDYVQDQVQKLVEAHRRTKALEEARKRLNLGPKPAFAPSVDDFRALDQAKAKAIGFGQAQNEAAEKGKTGLALLHQGWVKIAAGAAIAARSIGAVSAKYEEMQDRAQQGYRKSGGAALKLDQAFQSSGATDVEGLTEQAIGLKGPFSQEDVTGFVNHVVQRNPDVDDARWKTLFAAFQSTATVPGASQTLAGMAGLAPTASAAQLDRMTRVYSKTSGGRPMGDAESKSVKDLMETGFYNGTQAVSLVASLAANNQSGDVEKIVEGLTPPKPMGDPIKDTVAQDDWWRTKGYLQGQPGGADRALGVDRNGAVARRAFRAEYEMTTAAGGDLFQPRGLRAESEAGELSRERDLQVDTVPDAGGILRGKAEARRRAAIEQRKNAGARGELDRAATDLAADAAGKIGLGRLYNAYDRAVTGEAPDPSASRRPIQVEIVRDTTIRPLTY